MPEYESLLEEQFSEIVNILQCIVDYPKEIDPVVRSDYFKVIQTQTERALIKLDNKPLVLLEH
jgi:hypothetical protein